MIPCIQKAPLIPAVSAELNQSLLFHCEDLFAPPSFTVCVRCTFVSFAHRYFLRATISRRLNDITKEKDIVVHTLCTYPELNSSIKMEVGIEDCLHIEFEYNKSK